LIHHSDPSRHDDASRQTTSSTNSVPFSAPIRISNAVSSTIADYFTRRPVLQQSKSIQSNGGLEHAVKKRTPPPNSVLCIDAVGRTFSSGGKSCGENKKVDRVVHDSITVMASASPSSEEGDVSAINTRMIEDSQQEIDVPPPHPT